MDHTRKCFFCGDSGSGKTTLLKTLSASYDRVLHWDIEDEYGGQLVTLAQLPALFSQPAFRACYRPAYAQRPEDVHKEFEIFAQLVLDLKPRRLLVTVDEAVAVLPINRSRSGGLGLLLHRGRKYGVSVFYATQYVSQLAQPITGAAREFYLFHLDSGGDQQVLRRWIPETELRRVAALPPHEFVYWKK